MGFLDWMKKSALVDDEPAAAQAGSVAAVLAMSAIGLSRQGQTSLKRLVDSDGEEVPGARVRFGIDPSNPIRAHAPDGEVV